MAMMMMMMLMMMMSLMMTMMMITLTYALVQLQRDVSNTAAHSKKLKYMITGTRQKVSRCEECALSLCLDGRQLEQTQEERLLGLDIDPSLSCSSQIANLTKKLLKRVAVPARIKKFLPVIILFNASITPILEYCVSFWGSCNAGLLDGIFKVQKRCALIILESPLSLEPCRYFWNLGGYPLIKFGLKEDSFC